MRVREGLAVLTFIAAVIAPLAAQQPPAPEGAKDHVAALKRSLAESKAALRQYEWIETTVISIKGEEKSSKQSRCYYGAEGTLEKVPIDGDADGGKKPRGLRGAIVEHKKDEMTDAMKEAVGLVKQYIPPDPEKIKAAEEAGKLSIVPPDAQGRTQVVIKNYLKPGDTLSMSMAIAADRLTALTVSTYIDSTKDAVELNVQCGAFPDGTVYPAKIDLDVKKQELSVAVQNSGYKKQGS